MSAIAYVQTYPEITQKILAIAVAKSGTWTQLSKDIPISINHLYNFKSLKGSVKADFVYALLDHIDLLDSIEEALDIKIANLGISNAREH